jgi:hypothetical protein
VRWDLFSLADQTAAVVAGAEAELRLEQAVHGLDARKEVALQDLVAEGLRAVYEVAREVHYPSTVGRKLTHRQRCDLVLTPREQPLDSAANPPTLFDRRPRCPPEEALWLEMKIACQFREGGLPHPRYGSQWRKGVVEDLRKMQVEPRIREAALVLVVFNDAAETLARHLDLFESVLVQEEVLAGFRQVRSVPIADRRGHRLCSVAIWPTIQR